MTDKDIMITEREQKLMVKLNDVNNENHALQIEVNNLKGLLKEVKEFIEEENPKDYTIMSERMDELLTKINSIIGESEG